jgi:hypothetical protein
MSTPTRKTQTVVDKRTRSKIRQVVGGSGTNLSIAAEFNVSVRTVQRERVRAKRNEELPGLPEHRKRSQKPRYNEIEKVVSDTFYACRSNGLPVSGPHLQLLAREECQKLTLRGDLPAHMRAKYANATFGASWLKGFKERNSLRLLRINGERASVPIDYDTLMEPVRRFVAEKGIPPTRIFNWDETGLFYRAMPQYTLAGHDDTGAGTKADKSRITCVLSVNGDGTNSSIVLIGKSKNPHGTNMDFWRRQGIRYFSNSTAWMTKTIFLTLLSDFDASISEPAILLLDNFSGHSIDDVQQFTNVLPVFLPPNTTSKTQPLDAGIIASFKLHYRRKLMEFVLQRVREGGFRSNELSLARVTPWISEAMRAIKPGTIQKCFNRTLQLQLFEARPETCSANDDTMHELEVLEGQMEEFLNRDVQPENVLQFAQQDVTCSENQHEDYQPSEENETIHIAEPAVLLKRLDEYFEYFMNTNCTEEVCYLHAIRRRLLSHLAFK